MYKAFDLRNAMAAVVASLLFGSVLLTSAVSPAVSLPTLQVAAHAVA